MSKKNVFKKTLAVSTAVVLSSALLNFGPVSYKVFDNSTVVVHAAEVDDVKSLVQAVLNELNEDPLLKAPYEAAIAEAQAALSTLNILGSNTFLASKVVDSAAVEAAVIAVMNEALAYSKQTEVSSIPASFSAAVSNLNTALGTSITSSDVAQFLLLAQEKAINVDPTTVLTGLNIVSTLIDASERVMDEQWASGENELVKQLKGIYGANFNEVKNDLSVLKYAILDEADEAVLEKGGQALAIGYAKHQIKTTPNAITAVKAGNTYTISAITVKGIPVISLLDWETTAGKVETIDNNVVLDITGVTKPATVTLTGKLKGLGFAGVALVSQTVEFEADTVIPPVGPVTPVTPVVPVIPTPDTTAPITVNPDITPASIQNNTALQAALAGINAQLAKHFTVDTKDISTTVGQLTTVSLTSANFNDDFFKAYKTIIDNAKAKALEATGSDKIKPVMTLKVDTNSDAKVNIDGEVISKMKDAGLYAVVISTNEASLEVPLAGLDASAAISLTSAPADASLNASGVQSKVYSINVSEGGTVIPHTLQQYKVTIPVAADADVSKLTVAKLVDGKLTYVGGKYDEATNSIVFYSNEPGSFVAVEHEVSFADASRFDWAEAAIQRGAVHGILQGKTEGQFAPQDSVTRAEFTAMLVRALNLSASNQAASSVTFNDVSENAWYYSAVAAARAYGITNGRSPQQFDPNATITREEMASLASNALKSVLGFDASFYPANPFTQDGALIGPSHRQNVDFIANEGIMQGVGAGQFDPKKDVSRAEAIVSTIRLLEKR